VERISSLLVINRIPSAYCVLSLTLTAPRDSVLFLRANCPCRGPHCRLVIVAEGVKDGRGGVTRRSVCESMRFTEKTVLSVTDHLHLQLTVPSDYSTPSALARFWPVLKAQRDKFPVVMETNYSGYMTSLGFDTGLVLPQHVQPWASALEAGPS
jgi:hypothetical protein